VTEPIALKEKKIPEPLTDAELRERREMLRQQAEMLRTSRPTESGSHSVPQTQAAKA
jgi:hypothetical protein